MALAPGTRLGPYEVLGPIGAGGMGEVCRARDTKLDREVAIKVMPAAFARDPDRLARFEREAKVLASLNHANIAQIYGVEEWSEGRALVMELVPGAILTRPVALDTAIDYARQIASALDAAHEKGIVHRDLKPANIMITPDGVAKVLDFGLAVVPQTSSASNRADPENSPTLTAMTVATQSGAIMGTAGYMSPEQASGKPVDKRTDIFSFGIVFYEMLAGKRLFDGETASHALAAVLTKEPDWTALPATTPAWVRRLLVRCLDKNRKTRLRDIGEAFAFEGVQPVEPVTARAGLPHWAIPAIAGVALAAGLTGWLLRTPKLFDLPLRSFSFAPDSLTNIDYVRRAVISPNGNYVAYVAANKLWIRDLATERAQPLEGTEEAEGPFWSPDSTHVGFAAGDELKKSALAGGVPFRLAKTPTGYRGGAWSPDGRSIVFAGTTRGLYEVSSEGGNPELRFPGAPGKTFYTPAFVPTPSGKQVLIAGVGSRLEQTIQVLELKGGKRSELGQGAYPTYLSSGHILFQKEGLRGGLWVLKLKPGTIEPEGEPFPLLNSGSDASASADGTLLWVDRPSERRRNLVWRDRRGDKVGIAGMPQSEITDLSLSPDGTRVAYVASEGGHTDIWIMDMVRSVRTRLTFDSEPHRRPVWNPSAKEIAFGSGRRLLIRSVDGGGEPLPVATADRVSPAGWSPDGRTLLFNLFDANSRTDIWSVRRSLDGSFDQPYPFLNTAVNERDGRFSPDGRFVSYYNNGVLVRSFPDGRTQRQISVTDGFHGRWSRDGKEMFFVNIGRLFAVPVKTAQGLFEAGTPVELFRNPAFIELEMLYDVAPDSKRFLLVEPVDAGPVASPAIHIVQNWTAMLSERRRAHQ